MTPEGVDRLTSERQEADRRYNDALTTIDHLIVGIGARPITREDFDRLATALVVFLQQITAFVETKDRELAGGAGARIGRLEDALASMAELRTQVALLHRSVRQLTRAGEPSAAGRQPSLRPSAESQQQAVSRDEVLYLGFEDEFRGSDESVRARLNAYVPIFAGAVDVLDIGCGRGEFLAALQAAGISSRGVDVNSEMAGVARERGLDAVAGDGLGYLEGIPDETLGGLIATQVVEHLEPP
jgi:hypothetical protein